MGQRYQCLLAVFICVLSLVGNSTTSYAAGCVDEETIFMYSVQGSSNYGTSNQIDNTNRPLNSFCSTYTPLAWSTAHVRLGNLDGSWAETGWEEELDGFGGHAFYAFTEWGINYTTYAKNDFSIPCSFYLGGTSIWYTETFGNFAWTFAVDCNDGTGKHTLTSYANTGYSSAWAMGETGRHGGTATGMSDFQQNLRYKDVFGNWNSWGGTSCYSRTPSLTDWGSLVFSTQSYQILQGYGC